MFALSQAAAAAAPPPPPELRQLHGQLIKTGTPISGDLRRTAAIFAQSQPSVLFPASTAATWNSRIRATAESAAPIDAVFLFSLAVAAAEPDKYTFSFALKACSRLPPTPSTLAIAKTLHGSLHKRPHLFSELHLRNAVVHAYATAGGPGAALQAFDEMPERDSVSWNTVIAMLAKAGEMEAAEKLLSAMPEPTVRSWTAVIAGHVRAGDPTAAVRRLEDMRAAGVPANEVTAVAGLAAAGDLGDLRLGRALHRFARRRGFLGNGLLRNALIDMYAKCGSLEEAREVFEEMPDKTVVTWSTMISGLARHGRAEEAAELLERMVMAGVAPNGVTFLGLLQGYSHAGKVAEGRRVFAAMAAEFGVEPEMEHYGCMVDLLSRSGRLAEALEFIRGMPTAATAAVWGALLGGARLHGDVGAAEVAAAELRRLDPGNDGYRIVLFNAYAAAGLREKAAAVRVEMKGEGVKKKPGRSSVAVGGAVHEFGAGECAHPQAAAVRRRWEEMAAELRRRGYVPDTRAVLLDVAEEDKERALFGHSEKMALTFGLMNSPAGSTIRIIKNLRVCADCHAAFKLVSALTGREIVLRDRSRFHSFRDGACSCQDFW